MSEDRAVRPVFGHKLVNINFLNIELLYFHTGNIDLLRIKFCTFYIKYCIY